MKNRLILTNNAYIGVLVVAKNPLYIRNGSVLHIACSKNNIF